MTIRKDAINDIRYFNRHYVPLMRLLDQKYLDTPHTVMEADVLIEVSEHPGCGARDVVRELRVDKGYLSRMLRRFEGEGLLERKPSAADGRVRELYLTEAGQTYVRELVQKGVEVVGSAFAGASDAELAEVAASLRRTVNLMEGSRS